MIKKMRKLIGLMLCLSVLNGAMPQIFGQSQTDKNTRKISLVKNPTVAEAFEKTVRFGRNEAFVEILKRSLPADEVEKIFAWSDEKDARFFKAIYDAHEQKANEFAIKRLDSGPQDSKTEPVKQPVKTTPKNTLKKKNARVELPGGAFFQTASFQNFESKPAETEPEITTVETEDGVETGGKNQETIETAETIITKGSGGNAERIFNNYKNGKTYTQTTFEEIYNKKTRGRIKNEKKFHFSFTVAQCPDASGFVEGETTFLIENKATIADTKTIVIPAHTLEMKFKLKGFVNDEADLTHFDMTGEVIETATGFERAKRLDMIEETSVSDGTRRFTVSMLGNVYVGLSSSENKDGELRQGATANLTADELNRMIDFAETALEYNINNAQEGFSSARSNWQLGFCVDVSLAAPKEKLKSGEQITVSAETVHKLDNSKINARLEATGFAAVTPDKQAAATSAQFSVTASTDENFGAEITVKSISKRGIGTKTLKLGKEKPETKPKQTVKKVPFKKCKGVWTGKITAVKRKREQISKPASGRLVRQVEMNEETFSIDYYVLGIPDTTGGITNTFYSDAQMNYRAVKYSESLYASGKMSCGGKIIASTEMRKYESLMTGLSSERITVSITSTGEKGILTFGSPEIYAERINTTTYETSCPAYNQTNSSVDRGDGLIQIAQPSFEVEFELGADSDTQLNGAKTIQNSDGSETLFTWSLTRDCK